MEATFPRRSSVGRLFFSLFNLLSGCSLGPKYIDKGYHPPSLIAVLPFSNETNDTLGPETFRKLLIEMLPQRGYRVLDEAKVDLVLREKFGITEGGQLGSASPQKLGEALSCDGLFYGNVLKFSDIPLGFARKRVVRSNLKLLDSKSGDRIWEDEKSWYNPELHLNAQEAKEAAIRQVAERQLQRMTGTFLNKETRMMLELELRNLPLAR